MSEETPTVITLDNNNSVQIVCQYIEIAQNKGAYQLAEAEILKRAIDVAVNNVPDNEIDQIKARQILIQGVVRGQSSGAYTLNDAALLHKVVMFIDNSIKITQEQLVSQQPQQIPQAQPVQPQTPVEPQAPVEPQPVQQQSVRAVKSRAKKAASKLNIEEDFDLAEPIPLKPKEV